VAPVQLRAVNLRAVEYQETGAQYDQHLMGSAGAPSIADAQIEGKMNVLLEQTTNRPVVELLCALTITPPPNEKPIRIKVVFSAILAPSPELDLRSLLSYAGSQGARLLFPYMREMVASLTMRGIFGPILLAPVILGSLVPESELDRMTAEWQAGIRQS
jgi:preprotein translocase subunit SecB